MEIKFQVNDEIANNMTRSAIECLVRKSEAYTTEIIDEAKRVEQSTREHGAQIEITENTIFQAVRRNKTQVHKRNLKSILVKLGSEFGLFLSGILFNQKMLTENIIYFIIYFVIMTLTIISTIFTYIKEGE